MQHASMLESTIRLDCYGHVYLLTWDVVINQENKSKVWQLKHLFAWELTRVPQSLRHKSYTISYFLFTFHSTPWPWLGASLREGWNPKELYFFINLQFEPYTCLYSLVTSFKAALQVWPKPPWAVIYIGQQFWRKQACLPTVLHMLLRPKAMPLLPWILSSSCSLIWLITGSGIGWAAHSKKSKMIHMVVPYSSIFISYIAIINWMSRSAGRAIQFDFLILFNIKIPLLTSPRFEIHSHLMFHLGECTVDSSFRLWIVPVRTHPVKV